MDSISSRLTELNLEARNRMREKLIEQGHPSDKIEAAISLFPSAEQAAPYLAKTTSGYKELWKEYYSLKYMRYYYCNTDTAANVWEMPLEVQFSCWLLDVGIYDVDIRVCRQVTDLLLFIVAETGWEAEGRKQVVEGLVLMSKIVNNVVQCGNQNEKYRTVKTDNPKFKDKVASLPKAMDVLRLAGFRIHTDHIEFPPPEQHPDMNLANMVGAKLLQLVDCKGFTGNAQTVDDTSESYSSCNSKWHGTPGFRFQREIFECSVCSHPINDGSERLFTKKFDAPKGEFRYQCDLCQEFCLCESCWDKFNNGNDLHDRKHPFKAIHPKATQSHMYTSAAEGNPWGAFKGGSIGRARERLRERTGL